MLLVPSEPQPHPLEVPSPLLGRLVVQVRTFRSHPVSPFSNRGRQCCRSAGPAVTRLDAVQVPPNGADQSVLQCKLASERVDV